MSKEHRANHKFINAIRKGDLRELEKLIESHGIPDFPNWSKGYILLRFAVESKHTEIAELLLKNGSEVNDENGQPTTTPLHLAVKNDDIKMVEMLVKKGAEIDSEDAEGLTPLHIAVKGEFLGIAEHLLSRGARVNFLPTSYRRLDYTPLHLAIENGNEHLVELLLSKNANIQAEDKNGSTPLHIAVQFGRLKIIDYILSDELCKKKSYDALLHLAAQTGDEKMIDLLLTKGLNVNSKNGDNLTPLHVAIKYKHLTAVEFLLENKANVNARTDADETPLNLAVKIGCALIVESILRHRPDSEDESNRLALRLAIFECGSEFEKIIESLLSYGFAVNPKDMSDSCLLFSAVNNGHARIVEILLKHGADANFCETTKRKKKSLLHIAADKGQGSIVRLLIDYGADVNAKDEDDNSPILNAIKNGHLETVELLLSSGADVEHSFEPLGLAIRNNCAKIVEILLNYNAAMNDIDKDEMNGLHLAVSIADDEEIVKLIINKGVDVNAREKNGKTALHIAVEKKRKAVVNLLLENNADVDSPSENNVTPLHLAALNDNLTIAIMLIDKGANINAEQTDGATALYIATLNEYSRVRCLLLDRGADYDFRTNRDAELLHIVTKNEYSQSFATLVKRGADVDLIDDEGQTVLHLAAKNGHTAFVELLLDYGSDVNILNQENNTALDLAIAAKTSTDNNLSRTIARSKKTPRKATSADYENIVVNLSKHMLKMQLVGLYVSEQNLDEMIVAAEDCPLRLQCERHIKKMKNKMITDNVSFYDILTKDELQLEAYARNEKIVEVLEASEFQFSIPTYWSMINSRFRKALKRNRLLEQSSKFFNIFPPSVPILPRDCIMDILSYLSNRELILLDIVSSEAIDSSSQ